MSFILIGCSSILSDWTKGLTCELNGLAWGTVGSACVTMGKSISKNSCWKSWMLL